MRRRQRGHETLGQFALSMRLIVGKALRRMGRLREAEFAFKVLAGEGPALPCLDPDMKHSGGPQGPGRRASRPALP